MVKGPSNQAELIGISSKAVTHWTILSALKASLKDKLVVHKFGCSAASGIFRPGIKPKSPVLQGRFLTTQPTRKPCPLFFSLPRNNQLQDKNYFIFLFIVRSQVVSYSAAP